MHEEAEELSDLLETNGKSLKRIKPASVKIAPCVTQPFLTWGGQNAAFSLVIQRLNLFLSLQYLIKRCICCLNCIQSVCIYIVTLQTKDEVQWH